MKSNLAQSTRTNCPECGELVLLPGDMEVGEIMDCDNCGVELEVKSTQPPMVMVFEEEEK